MNKYLPSKKFIIFIGSVLVVAGVIWAGAILLGKKTKYEKKDVEVVSSDSEANNFYTNDSDKDGVYDWEESLWGTDPKKKDTDGNGVTDGDEIEDRKKEIQAKNNISGSTDLSEDLNQTEIFARELFSAASLANQNGGLSPEDLQNFSTSFGKSVSNAGIEDIYKPSDLKLSAVSPVDYKKNLSIVFKEYINSGLSTESAMYRLSTGDSSAADDLEKIAELQHGVSNKLIGMQVPYAVAGPHLAIANNSAKISIALLSLKNLEEDPILAMIGLRQYFEYSAEYEKAISDLSAYFKANGII